MFICGYHFPASMGNKISHEQVVEKVTSEVGDLSDVSYAVLTSENRDGIKQEDLRVEKGSFLFTALADYYKKSDIEGEYKMIFYTNKYQMSEVSKAVDGGATAAVCKKLDDMLLYRVKVA